LIAAIDGSEVVVVQSKINSAPAARRIRYVLAPKAAVDLVQIWVYIKQKADFEIANRVEAVIRQKILRLSHAVPVCFDTLYRYVFPLPHLLLGECRSTSSFTDGLLRTLTVTQHVSALLRALTSNTSSILLGNSFFVGDECKSI